MTYRSFNISDNEFGLRIITRRGKQVFTARWQDCWNLETAKKLIDDSLKMKEDQASRGKHESQILHEGWYKKAILFKEDNQ